MNAFRMNRQSLLSVGFVILALSLAACSDRPKTAEQQDKELQQKSAEVTATIKEGAKKTAAETKQAADVAEHKLDVVAAGVKEGLQSPNSRMDLNSATTERIAALPGIGERKAGQIVKLRPYGSSHDLVAKGVLTESQYERISPRVTAR